MKPDDESKNSQFKITEKELPLNAWDSNDLEDPLIGLSQDLGRLTKHLAEEKQAHSESERAQKQKIQKILESLAETLDAFERVFASVEKKKDQVSGQMKIWLGNFRTVYRLTQRILSDQGVVPIEHLNDEFDPRWHKAIDSVADPEKDDGAIYEVKRKGYLWQGRVLRKTEVIVVRNADNPDSMEDDSEETPSGDNDELEPKK